MNSNLRLRNGVGLECRDCAAFSNANGIRIGSSTFPSMCMSLKRRQVSIWDRILKILKKKRQRLVNSEMMDSMRQRTPPSIVSERDLDSKKHTRLDGLSKIASQCINLRKEASSPLRNGCMLIWTRSHIHSLFPCLNAGARLCANRQTEAPQRFY